MAKKSILIVDPDAVLSALLEDILGEEGYRVRSIRSLDEAVALLAEHHFDLVITEAYLQRGRLDFDPAFLPGLKAAAGDTPLVLLSTYTSTSTIHVGDFGLAQVVPKPFDIDDLLNKVARALGNTSPAVNGPKRRA